MTRLYSPVTLAILGTLITIVLMASPNAMLWGASILTLPVCIWLLGGRRAFPVLVWLISLKWLQIAADVLDADLSGRILGDGWMGQYHEQAIYFSLCAIASMAFGMGCGTRLGGRVFGSDVRANAASPAEDRRSVNLHRVVVAYFISLILCQVLGTVARAIPSLAQPLLALVLLKFACVYLVTTRVFVSERGYQWLLLISFAELTTGVGFFASYKEPIFVMLIGIAASRGAMSTRKWIFTVTSVIALVWMSLVWMTVRNDYRYHILGNPLEQRVEWLSQRFLVDSIDYRDAAIRLVQRIGYTDLYAQLLARIDLGVVPKNLSRYQAAVQHVLSPRVLFPDKPSLNDSRLTTMLLGFQIDKDTSIGIGFVAEAHLDFGFPGLLLPLFLLGTMIGGTAQYFMTRPAPLIIREAFTTAGLFLAFPFEANIDKTLGSYITGCVVMALVLKFAYPMVARWLAGANRRINVEQSVGSAPT
jgi:hypothetical protein